MIIANDIKIQQKKRKGERVFLASSSRALIFNRKKAYYKGNSNVKKSLEWAF